MYLLYGAPISPFETLRISERRALKTALKRLLERNIGRLDPILLSPPRLHPTGKASDPQSALHVWFRLMVAP